MNIIKPGDEKLICDLYAKEFIPMIELAKRYGVTRMAIWKVLKRNNIETSKGKASQITTKCLLCGTTITRVRCLYRKTLHSFCSKDHYFQWLKRRDPENPLLSNRLGLHQARKIISKHFNLQKGMVVHHEDRNQFNNELSNLRVFLTQADHIRYHREIKGVAPIWNGNISQKSV